MSDKKIKEENLDEIVQNVVKDIKKGKQFSNQEIDKLMKEANENLEFIKVIDDIKLASPDDRVIFVDGNEELVYDHGEFFICDTVDARKPKKKIKRKEATEKYIEYFIRYQLNPIIEQKKMYNMTKSIEKTEIKKPTQTKTKITEKKIATKIEAKESVETEKPKTASKKSVKAKDDMER